jgi:C_GCAxxG_C_C family probable redox protein
MKMSIERRKALRIISGVAAASAAPALACSLGSSFVVRALGLGDPASKRSLKNALQMGHCAPTIMQTLLESAHAEDPQLIKLVAGLPGGIGNQGAECGGVTATVLYLGLVTSGDSSERMTTLLDVGRSYVERFEKMHGSLDCREINMGMKPCLKAICSSAKLLLDTAASPHPAPSAASASCRRSFDLLAGQGFHCANQVLGELPEVVGPDDRVFRAVSGLVGGTLMLGRTCSALTAGVLALGLRLGEIERSRPRVLMMMAKMMSGGDAMRDDVNGFNKAIHAGERLAGWFRATQGSIRCRELLGFDSASASPADWLAQIPGCRKRATAVAGQVRRMLGDKGAIAS